MNPIRWFGKKFVYSVGFAVGSLLIAGALVFYVMTVRSQSVHVVRIGYAAGAAVRKHFLEQMALHGKKHGLDIRLVPTVGTDVTISLIDRNDIDMGLVAGGLEDRASRRILEVTPLYMEPLQLLVRNDLYDSISRDFGQLRGKTIGVDTQSSSTNLIATELLRFIGLVDPVSGQPQYKPVYLSQARLPEIKDASQLPDAIFQIAGVPSPVMRKVITDDNYRLVALPFGGSFNLSEFRESDAPDTNGTATLRLNKSVIEEFVIPAFAYRVLPPVPPSDTRTIATRLLLAGSPKLDADVVRKVLDLVYSPEISAQTKPALNIELLNTSFEYDRHPGTDSYLSSLKPFEIEEVLRTYSRLVEIWGIFLTLYVGLTQAWKWWTAHKEEKHGISVRDLMSQVLSVESEVRATCTDEERVRLDERLSEIKKRSIELHVGGRLEDAEHFPSLMVTLADTRTKIWGAGGRSVVS